MKNRLWFMALLIGAATAHTTQTGRQRITLRNADTNPHTFHIKYGAKGWCSYGSTDKCPKGTIRCPDGDLALGAGRTKVLFWQGDCPLESITTQITENGTTRTISERMIDEEGNVAHKWRVPIGGRPGEWVGEREIVFYPRGFYPTSKKLLKLELGIGDNFMYRRIDIESAELRIDYDHYNSPGSTCPSGDVTLPHKGENSVKIWSGGDCPIHTITGHVYGKRVEWSLRGRQQSDYEAPVHINMKSPQWRDADRIVVPVR